MWWVKGGVRNRNSVDRGRERKRYLSPHTLREGSTACPLYVHNMGTTSVLRPHLVQ